MMTARFSGAGQILIEREIASLPYASLEKVIDTTPLPLHHGFKVRRDIHEIFIWQSRHASTSFHASQPRTAHTGPFYHASLRWRRATHRFFANILMSFARGHWRIPLSSLAYMARRRAGPSFSGIAAIRALSSLRRDIAASHMPLLPMERH